MVQLQSLGNHIIVPLHLWQNFLEHSIEPVSELLGIAKLVPGVTCHYWDMHLSVHHLKGKRKVFYSGTTSQARSIS